MKVRYGFALGWVLLLVGCPGDGGSGDEVGETQGDSDTTDEGDSTGDGDTDTTGDGDGDGEPTCPTSLEGQYEPGQYAVQTEAVFTPDLLPGNFVTLQAMCQDAEDDFEWEGDIDWATVNVNGVDLAIYRPADPVGGDWPAGQFPIVFHHHGNGGQDGELYEHIAEAVVDDGAVFVSVAEELGANADLRAMIDICMLRWLFTADDWDGTGSGTGGAAKLDGNVVVMGHSTGGEGAHIVNNWFEERPWQDDLDAPEHNMRLCGVVGICPRGAELSPFSDSIHIAGDATVPYLTIEGSLDNDVPGGSLWNSSHSGIDELPTSTDAAKITAWVYDAEHDSFGGGGTILPGNTHGILSPTEQRARGELIAEILADAFVRRFVFGDIAAEPVLFGHEVPTSLDVPLWWDYHPAYAGEPLIFFGTEPHQSSAMGELGTRMVVDTMVRSNSLDCAETDIGGGPGVTSEGSPFFADNWPAGSLRSHCAVNLAAYNAARGEYQTFVARADFTAPPDELVDPAERSLAWNLDFFDLQDAVAFSFRASNVDEVIYPGMGMGCSPADEDTADTVDFEVVFASLDNEEVTVNVSDYARLVAPDVFEVAHSLAGSVCPVSHFLQTVRVPLDEVLCDSFPPEDLREVRFVFDRFDGPEGRAVLLDTVEFHRDLSGAPVCGG